jgi:GWxTD domain-containing protein
MTRSVALVAVGVLILTPSAVMAARPSPAPQDEADFQQWVHGPVALLMLAEEVEIVGTIATAAEARAFREWFWARRDPDSTTTVNEFRAEVRDRLAYVDREFGEPGAQRAGWATARGKLYLLLGPPDRVMTARDPIFLDGRLRRPVFWDYAARFGSGPVRFALVETADGFRILTAGSGRLAAGQIDRVETTREEAIDSGVPIPTIFTVGDRRADPLPLVGSSERHAEGILAKAHVRLQDLLGDPGDDAIRFRFALGWRPAGVATTTIVPLGELDFTVPLDELGEWADQPLNIALWYKTPSGLPGTLYVREVTTGRRAEIEVADSVDLPGQFAVARQLALVSLANGDGVAIAFFPTCRSRHPQAIATLVRLPPGNPEHTPALPGGRLALLSTTGEDRR